eukprot:1160921-Pelagomonas_calceolata.AAC.2
MMRASMQTRRQHVCSCCPEIEPSELPCSGVCVRAPVVRVVLSMPALQGAQQSFCSACHAKKGSHWRPFVWYPIQLQMRLRAKRCAHPCSACVGLDVHVECVCTGVVRVDSVSSQGIGVSDPQAVLR